MAIRPSVTWALPPWGFPRWVPDATGVALRRVVVDFFDRSGLEDCDDLN